MHHKIQHPVTEHQAAEYPRSSSAAPDSVIEEAHNQRPAHRHGQAMRERIVIEIERLNLGDPRCDSHMLESEKQQYRPEKVQKLRSQNQRAQRGPRSDALCRQGNTKMSDEHLTKLAHRPRHVPQGSRPFWGALT